MVNGGLGWSGPGATGGPMDGGRNVGARPVGGVWHDREVFPKERQHVAVLDWCLLIDEQLHAACQCATRST
jgi:hypothetical protein